MDASQSTLDRLARWRWPLDLDRPTAKIAKSHLKRATRTVELGSGARASVRAALDEAAARRRRGVASW